MSKAKKINYVIDDTKTGLGVEKALFKAYNDLKLNL